MPYIVRAYSLHDKPVEVKVLRKTAHVVVTAFMDSAELTPAIIRVVSTKSYIGIL